MENKTYEQILEIATRRKDFVIPIILDYYELEKYGFKEENILKAIREKYK